MFRISIIGRVRFQFQVWIRPSVCDLVEVRIRVRVRVWARVGVRVRVWVMVTFSIT